MRRLTRPDLRRWLHHRSIQLPLLFLLIFLTIDVLIVLPIARHARASHATLSQTLSPTPTHPRPDHGKIFLTAALRNNAALISAHWRPALVALVKMLGPENVYVSIVASGSEDDTAHELARLNMDLMVLGALRRFAHAEGSFEQQLLDAFPDGDGGEGKGWRDVPGEGRRLRQASWSAHVRNLQLEPLDEMNEKGGLRYGRLVFIDDGWFEPEDVMQLLGSRGGNYSAVCGLDYTASSSWDARLSDTAATRDADGQPLFSAGYPYFAQGASRRALEQMEVVPVRSCWGGITVLDGAPFQTATARLRFRALGDGFADEGLEASEACLLHHDNLPNSGQGVWINPVVRTGRSEAAYGAVHRSGGWPSTAEVRNGVWQNTLMRVFNLPWTNVKIRPAYRRWKAANGTEGEEVGYDCLGDEVQVIEP